MGPAAPTAPRPGPAALRGLYRAVGSSTQGQWGGVRASSVLTPTSLVGTLRCHGTWWLDASTNALTKDAVRTARPSRPCLLSPRALPVLGVRAIRVRIGLHTGEAVKDGGDFLGKHVILAARIAAQAAGGETLVPSILTALTEGAADFRYGAEQQVVLQGLAGTRRVCGAVWA